jgi:hypothetical protein
MRKPTVLQINAVALSVALGGSYVYYRAAQGQQQRDQVMTSSKMRPLTAQRLAATTQSSSTSDQSASPTTAPKAVFYGTKSAVIDFAPAKQSPVRPSNRSSSETRPSRTAPATHPTTTPDAK